MAVSVTPTYRSAPLLDKPNAARSKNHRTTGLFSRSTQFVPWRNTWPTDCQSQPNSVNRKGFRYVQRRAVTELAPISAARQWAVISARIRKIGCV